MLPIYPAGETNQPKIGLDRPVFCLKSMLKMAKTKDRINFSLVNPHSGGIDVGSRSHWVSTGLEEGRSKEFGVFTEMYAYVGFFTVFFTLKDVSQGVHLVDGVKHSKINNYLIFSNSFDVFINQKNLYK